MVAHRKGSRWLMRLIGVFCIFLDSEILGLQLKMSSTVLGAGWNVKDTRLLQGGCGHVTAPGRAAFPPCGPHVATDAPASRRPGHRDQPVSTVTPVLGSCTALLTSSLEIPHLRPHSEPASCLPTQLQGWGAAPHLFLSHCSQSPGVTCEQSPKGDTREWSADFTWAMHAGVWAPPVPS